jgi:multiple sugar transport system permease protein
MRLCHCILATVVLCLLTGWAVPARAMELRFSYWGNFSDNEMWRAICQDFERAHPGIRIKREWIVGQYAEKLPLLFISDTAADIILMDDETSPGYGARGYLEDLTPFIERDGPGLRLDDFMPHAMESFAYGGMQVGMPWNGLAVVVFYNKDLLDAAGLAYPGEDWTWDDFRTMARALTVDLDGDGRTDQFGTNIGFGWLGMQPIIWSFGGDTLNEDRTASAIHLPEAIEACQLVYDMKWTDHSIAWTGEGDSLTTEAQLLTGRVGMILAPVYTMFMLERIDEGMDWGVAHLPHGPRGHRHTRVSFDGISINSGISPERQEAAWTFIKHVIGRDTQRLIADLGRAIPVRLGDAEELFAGDDPARRVAVEAMLYGKLTPITPKYMELRSAIQGEFMYLNTRHPSIHGRARKTVREALTDMQPKIDQVLADELARWGEDRVEKARRSPMPVLAALVALFVMVVATLLYRNREELRWTMGSRMGRQEALWGLLFASPWLLGLCLFTAFPIIFSIVLSLCEWDPYDKVSAMSLIGFANFRAAATDPLLRKALWNTFVYALWSVPLGLSVSLGLAVLLNQKVRGISVFRTTFYVPTIVGGVATAILWVYIFDPVFGPLNGMINKVNVLLDWTRVLAFIDLPEPGWLFDPAWAKPSLVIMHLWGSGGGAMLIFLAGLQGVPDQLYEVAELDGAGRLRKFWNITLPMLTPTIYFNFIMGMIGGWQTFMQAFVMVGDQGGVDQSLLFYVLYLYRKAFVEYEMGYASAMAWILFVIILSFTLLVIRSSAVWVYYEGEKK